MARKFDRFMLDVNIASHPKLARLTVPERWTLVAGILPLAAISPIRGQLLIGHQPAEAEDVAHHARVPVKVAAAAMEKLRAVGMLVHNPDLNCDEVHDWDDWNPAPKSDPSNADRQRRFRERHNSRNDKSNGAVTPPEVEGEEEEKKGSGDMDRMADLEPPLTDLGFSGVRDR
jgi:hypothetical protein